MNKPLAEKLVVITGASSEIGKATALAFIQKGAQVVIASYNFAALDELVEQSKKLGAPAEAIMTVATDINAVKILANSAARIGNGRIDFWINIAEAGDAGKFLELPIEVHDEIIRANLLAYIYAAHVVLPYFKRQQQGFLINHISGSVALASLESVAYNTIKSGIEGFSLSLRKEIEDMPDIAICDVYSFLPDINDKLLFTTHQQNLAPQQLVTAKTVAENIVELALNPKDYLYIDPADIAFGQEQTLTS
jgi:NAD(P)-dependent dehydrogenase (short-subunit alcohol dehydrogenase family)